MEQKVAKLNVANGKGDCAKNDKNKSLHDEYLDDITTNSAISNVKSAKIDQYFAQNAIYYAKGEINYEKMDQNENFYDCVFGHRNQISGDEKSPDGKPCCRLARIRDEIVLTKNWPFAPNCFPDFLGILRRPEVRRDTIQLLAEKIRLHLPDIEWNQGTLTHDNLSEKPVIVGLDSRGFLLGPLLAERLGLIFVTMRKKGKLPPPTLSQDFDRGPYGPRAFEMLYNSLSPGQRVVLVDDIVAQGITFTAANELVQKFGASVALCLAVVELPFYKPREVLRKKNLTVESLVFFEGP